MLLRRVVTDWWAPLAALALCPLVAWWRPGTAAEATAHAGAIAAAERHLGVYVEPAVAAWTADRPALSTAAWVLYLSLHVPVTGAALIWTRLERPVAWPWVRDLFVVTQTLVMTVAVVVPTAPPTSLPGFGSPVGREPDHGVAELLQSPFAAMPSGHVAFALIAGGVVLALTARPWLRAAGAAYPVLVVALVVATGNHFAADCAAATLVVAAAGGLVVARRAGVRELVRLPLRA